MLRLLSVLFMLIPIMFLTIAFLDSGIAGVFLYTIYAFVPASAFFASLALWKMSKVING